MSGSGRKRRPKVQELADELGLKVRDVLAAAREQGIAVQNRITRLDPTAEARLRMHFARPPDADTADTEGESNS